MIHQLSPVKRLRRIREIIDAVEVRCAAVDGPVTPTHEEITDAELRTIYRLANWQLAQSYKKASRVP